MAPADCSHLPPEQRRKKLQSRINNISQEIQREKEQRYENRQLLQPANAGFLRVCVCVSVSLSLPPSWVSTNALHKTFKLVSTQVTVEEQELVSHLRLVTYLLACVKRFMLVFVTLPHLSHKCDSYSILIKLN